MAFKEGGSLPLELEDDQQSAVLYSPFREKSLNPQSWNRKMKFWENTLTMAALQRNIVTFHINSITLLFERKGITPKCFASVIDELKRSGKIKHIEHYQRDDDWLSWGFNTLVKQPITWGISQLLGSSKKDEHIYVWVEVAKKLGEEVLSLHQATVQHEVTDNLMSISSLRTLSQDLILSEQDFNVVLKQLERDRKIAVIITSNKQMIIKSCKKEESVVSPISELELQVYQLHETQKRLEKEIEVMSSRAEIHLTEARSYVREGRKTMAMHCLRKKKAILKTVDRKSNSLATLHDIIQKIEEAGTNDMVVKACQAGVAALKTLNAEVTFEKVETLMDEMQEVTEYQEDINQVLSSFSTLEIDDGQLEIELEALLQDYDSDHVPQAVVTGDNLASESNLDRDLLNSLSVDDMGLPNVPTHSPSKSCLKDAKKTEAFLQS